MSVNEDLKKLRLEFENVTEYSLKEKFRRRALIGISICIILLMVAIGLGIKGIWFSESSPVGTGVISQAPLIESNFKGPIVVPKGSLYIKYLVDKGTTKVFDKNLNLDLPPKDWSKSYWVTVIISKK